MYAYLSWKDILWHLSIFQRIFKEAILIQSQHLPFRFWVNFCFIVLSKVACIQITFTSTTQFSPDRYNSKKSMLCYENIFKWVLIFFHSELNWHKTIHSNHFILSFYIQLVWSALRYGKQRFKSGLWDFELSPSRSRCHFGYCQTLRS